MNAKQEQVEKGAALEPAKYNGWTNYETWAVNLWLTNDEGTYSFWKVIAKAFKEEKKEDAAIHLSKSLKEFLTAQANEKIREPCLFSDLLNAALSEVDWYEVAEAFLED